MRNLQLELWDTAGNRVQMDYNCLLHTLPGDRMDTDAHPQMIPALSHNRIHGLDLVLLHTAVAAALPLAGSFVAAVVGPGIGHWMMDKGDGTEQPTGMSWEGRMEHNCPVPVTGTRSGNLLTGWRTR